MTGTAEKRVDQIDVRKTVERTRFELRAANEIGLVCIDAQRVTIGVDARRRERKQVSTPREGPTGGNDQISHLTCFGIDDDAVQSSQITVLIVPDGEVSICTGRAPDTFRIQVTEPVVRGDIGAHASWMSNPSAMHALGNRSCWGVDFRVIQPEPLLGLRVEWAGECLSIVHVG